MTELDIEKVEKALGEPVAPEFSEYVRKLRNNLFLISTIGITMMLGELQLDPNSTFLGLRFTGLNNNTIVYVLFIINSYILVHFVWCSFDALQCWFVRITGTRVAFITAAKYASEGGDYPSDARQSSLYHWWKTEAKRIGNLKEPMDNIQAMLAEWESRVQSAFESNDSLNVATASQGVGGLATEINNLKRAVENSAKTIESSRIPVSLSRFDKRYLLFLRSQNLRWLLLEISLPIGLAAYSLALLWPKL